MLKKGVLCDTETNVAYSHLCNLGVRQSSKGKQKPNYCLTDSVHFIYNPFILAFQRLFHGVDGVMQNGGTLNNRHCAIW